MRATALLCDHSNGTTASFNRMNTIYADYQATTPVDPRVVERMAPYWSESFGNPHSSDHAVGWRAAQAVTESQASVARLIGADPDEMIFTSGATEANNLALLGLARRAPANRRRILVSAIEHKCVLAAARALEEREGFSLEIVPVDRDGFVDLEALRQLLDDTVLLVSIMAVNNEVGTIQDVARIASLARQHDVLFHCDAAQAPCAIDLSSFALHADLISLSGHKMYGPQGIGVLYIRRDIQERIEPIMYGGGQQAGLRSGTVPTPLCVGMGVAADILRTSEAIEERRTVARNRDSFVSELLNGPLPPEINGPVGNSRHPGNANVRFPGCSAEDILGVLQPRLAASTGAACTSGVPEPSHVLRAMGLSDSDASSSIRFSFGRFSTAWEIRQATTLVNEALQTTSSI